MQPVGVVRALYRYPVKSMGGERIDESRVGWQGLAGDRRYAFVRSGDTSDFPWLTARQVPALLQHRPYLCDPADPANSAVMVRTPEGEDLSIESGVLREDLARRHGAPIHLMQSGRGTFDAAALSLLSANSLDALGARLDGSLDPRRFRPNILIETYSSGPFAEEEWLGALLIFGDRDGGARIRVNLKDRRCMMVNLDHEAATQNPAVLREIVRSRETCMGVYASTEAIGSIREGDIIYLRLT